MLALLPVTRRVAGGQNEQEGEHWDRETTPRRSGRGGGTRVSAVARAVRTPLVERGLLLLSAPSQNSTRRRHVAPYIPLRARRRIGGRARLLPPTAHPPPRR